MLNGSFFSAWVITQEHRSAINFQITDNHSFFLVFFVYTATYLGYNVKAHGDRGEVG